MFHFDGTDWVDQSGFAGTAGCYGIWGNGTGEVYSMWGGDELWVYDGSSWSYVDDWGGTSDLFGFGTGDLWAGSVDYYGHAALSNFTGSTSVDSSTGIIGTSRSVWGSSPSDMYIVGDNGLILEMCP